MHHCKPVTLHLRIIVPYRSCRQSCHASRSISIMSCKSYRCPFTTICAQAASPTCRRRHLGGAYALTPGAGVTHSQVATTPSTHACSCLSPPPLPPHLPSFDAGLPGDFVTDPPVVLTHMTRTDRVLDGRTACAPSRTQYKSAEQRLNLSGS